MEGFEDPFNRRTFPWGEEDRELEDWFTALGKARKELAPLRKGELEWLTCRGRLVSFVRSWQGQRVIAAANAGEREAVLELPGGGRLRLSPLSGALLAWTGGCFSSLL